MVAFFISENFLALTVSNKMFFGNHKRKKAVRDFYDQVKIEFLTQEDSEIMTQLNTTFNKGYELIENNEWGLAFENLTQLLIENYFIPQKSTIYITREIIKLCDFEEQIEYDLRRILSMGYVKGSWRLEDAEQNAKENKYTFYKPSKIITDQLKVGNLVKIVFEFETTNPEQPTGERMWVEIIEIKHGKFHGKLDNHPFYLHDLFVGDEIIFEHKHIIDHDLEITENEPSLLSKYNDRCMATKAIMYDNAPINYFYKEEPQKKTESHKYKDSGWRFLTGNETDEYLDDSENIKLTSLVNVLNLDDSFIHLLDSEIGSYYERNEDGEFKKIED